MKRWTTLLIVICMLGITIPAMGAMSISKMRQNTRFLTDRMAYELKLTPRQYNDVYEVNYDFINNVRYLMDDVVRGYDYALERYYDFLDVRNDDLRWILSQSLLKKKGEAIKNLELAYDNGFQDYNHMMNDTDLDNLRSDKRFKAVLAKVKKVGDYLDILQKTPGYTHNERPDTLPRFEYINPNNKYLVEVRQYFKLDSVAGAGDELSKIKNILTYIHNTIKHDGNHESPAGSNIIKWAEACKGGARGLHCGGLAHVLKDCYLSMGFKARHISGLPKKYIGECHSINVVYSNTLDKWIWVDPTNNAWVMDENGIMLSVQEVRERLRDGRPVILNEEANWNNQQKITKEYYLDSYMAKNLYSIKADDVLLCPSDPNAENFFQAKYVVNDDAWFWQSPYQE